MEAHDVWKYTATTSIGIIITMITFWVSIVKNMVSKTEVLEMIKNDSIYMRDKQFIMEKLATNKETQTQFSLALQRNTEVMNELKIQIATLSKTLEALEERIER